MKINVNHHKKQVEVWQTRAEQQDRAVQAQLDDLYREYQEKKYLVAVFRSGDGDLYRSTLDLLRYNKRRVPELEVLQEKQQTSALES